ncbi:MAG: hypothetical protein ACI80V_003714 [Rhodothermales bacterium]|jgi:hypothetical protein
MWRLFGEVTGGVLREHNPAGAVRIGPGFAFWLRSRTSATFDTGPLTSVAANEPFARELLPGWNLVGNPFGFPIPAEKVTSSSGLVDARRYDGAWSSHEGPWIVGEEYAVHNSGTAKDTLFIDPDLSSVSTNAAPKWEASLDWTIGASAVKSRSRDADNLAVLAPSASMGWDLLDRPEPPVIGDYVSVSFEGERFPLSVDARPAGSSWPLVITTATAGVVRLTFEVPETVSAHVFDPATGTSHDLSQDPAYSVASAGEGSERRLELRTGAAPTEVPPTEFGLDPIFPNPSAGAVTLSFRLPEPSDIELSVFDVLGRKIATLANGSRAVGTQVVVWDAGTSPPGLYAILLRSGQRTATRSMLLAR